jgi:muconate cycloisomerase
LKIERVEVFGVAVPLIGQYKTAHTSSSFQKSAIVRITAGGDAIGLGNVDPVPGYSEESVEDTLRVLTTVFTPLLIGLDPRNIHSVLNRMDGALETHLEAKAAVEMACVDLTARACGMPVHVYLGGAVKERLLFNAWIGMLPPDEAACEAMKWQKRGFLSAKIKVGGTVEEDRDRIGAVREAVGPHFKLRIDANASYDAETAIKLASIVAQYDLELFEQPVAADDIAGMARVKQHAYGIPIMADESVLDHRSLIRIVRANAADMIKVKIMKQGGIHNTHRMIATAEAAGIRCVVGHGFGLGVNTMAEIMVAATSRNVIDGLECVGPLKTADDITTQRIDLSSGSLSLPSEPGLAVSLDQAKVDRYRL